MFYSKVDEDAFFGWTHKITAVKEVFGEIDEIVLLIDSASIEDNKVSVKI